MVRHVGQPRVGRGGAPLRHRTGFVGEPCGWARGRDGYLVREVQKRDSSAQHILQKGGVLEPSYFSYHATEKSAFCFEKARVVWHRKKHDFDNTASSTSIQFQNPPLKKMHTHSHQQPISRADLGCCSHPQFKPKKHHTATQYHATGHGAARSKNITARRNTAAVPEGGRAGAGSTGRPGRRASPMTRCPAGGTTGHSRRSEATGRALIRRGTSFPK